MIDDYHQLLQEVDGEGTYEPEELEPQAIRPTCSRGRSTGVSGETNYNPWSLSRPSWSRISVADEELRMLDEANGWTYEVR